MSATNSQSISGLSRNINAILVVISLTVSCLIGELALPILKPGSKSYPAILEELGPPQPMGKSDYLPFTLPSSVSFKHSTDEFDVTYEFNQFGYRGDYPAAIEPTTNTNRIICLGDSFTLGWGNSLKDSYVERISAGLRQISGNFEVINAGYHDAYSPDSYYAYLVAEGLKLKPRSLIAFLYPDNDLDDIQENVWVERDIHGLPTKLSTIRNYTDYRGSWLKSPMERLSWNYQIPLLNRSHLFIAGTNFINRLTEKSSAEGHRVHKEITEQTWARFANSIEGLQRLSTENALKLNVALIPARDTILTGERQEIYARAMKIVTERTQIPPIDLRSELRVEDYFKHDAHLNPVGNELVSKSVLKAIQP